MRTRRRINTRKPRLWRRPGNGLYYIVWTENRNSRKRSTRTDKRAEAEAHLQAFLADYELLRPTRRFLSLHEGVQEWLADRRRPRQNLQPTTLAQYERYARLFTDHFPPSLRAADVTPAMIRAYLNRREEKQDGKKVGAMTLRKELVALSMVFRFLLREGHVHGNPCNAVQVRARPKRHPAMTDDEFARLRGAMAADLEAAGDPAGRADAQELMDLADVLWHSGLRYVEAIRLRWEDVDLDKILWTIRSPENKGGEQTLPFHPALLPLLRRRRLLGAPGPFRDYWPLLRLWSVFKRRHTEFRGWSWHRMRHAFVTRLRSRGLDAAAMALARHSTPAMSERYTHLDLTTLRKSLEAI